jgi:hypothetical protein
MFIDVRSQKAFSAPAGRQLHARMSLLVELARLFLPELYTFRAAGASQMLYPQNPMRPGKLNSQKIYQQLDLSSIYGHYTGREVCSLACPME